MEKKDLRVVFMGTPDFGAACLDMLHQEGYHLVGVFTQPDRKAGRGHKLVPPPIKTQAELLEIPVYQFEKIKQPEGVAALRALAPDVCITAAFGQILSQEILDIPKYGVINVHASLLPKLRGSAPIQWAIITGEQKTGITTMKTALALDAGDILEQDELDLAEDWNAQTLYEKLSALGAQTLRRTMEKLLAGTLHATPQREEEATYYPMFQKGFGQIDFTDTCRNIYNFVRGCDPHPGAFMMLGETKVKIIRVTAKPGSRECRPGTIVFADRKNGFVIAAEDGLVEIDVLQWPGKSPVSARDFLLGHTVKTGQVPEEAK